MTYFPTANSRTVFKAADESRNTTVTFADDSDLVLPVEASTDYQVDYVMTFFTTSATPQAKSQLRIPAAADITNGVTILRGLTIGPDEWRWENYPRVHLLPASENVVLIGKGTLEVFGSAGDFAIQWAQQTSDATDVTVLRGAWLRLTKL